MDVHTVVFTAVFTYGDTWWYASGSVVDVDVDKLALYMHIQGTMHLKKQFTDACSHSSVHTALFTDGDTWWYASGSVVDVDVDKLALYMHMQGTIAFKEAIHRWMFTKQCSHIVHTWWHQKVNFFFFHSLMPDWLWSLFMSMKGSLLCKLFRKSGVQIFPVQRYFSIAYKAIGIRLNVHEHAKYECRSLYLSF